MRVGSCIDVDAKSQTIFEQVSQTVAIADEFHVSKSGNLNTDEATEKVIGFGASE